jgi:hypothetical protein
MPRRLSKSLPDVNEVAHWIMAQTTGTAPAPPEKNPHAVALGLLGGSKGGKIRAAKLSPAKRRAIAKKAARARWANRAKTSSVSVASPRV